MDKTNHTRITAAALAQRVSPLALAAITAANLGQDALRYQFGYDHLHYDNNAFTAGDAYLETQRDAVYEALARGKALPAWQAFGRLTHSAQDFYAHSNYVELWRARQPDAAPEDTDPLAADLLTHPRLRSGRLYYPLEALSFIPALQPLVIPLLPRDSHAWLNKDYPTRPNFDFAYHAAIRRTIMEFERIAAQLQPETLERFSDARQA
jgi:hypothetical protein